MHLAQHSSLHTHISLYIYSEFFYRTIINQFPGHRVELYNATAFNEWVDLGEAPALPESLKLYNKLLSLGIKIVFITGRPLYQQAVTATNLKLAGYHTWEKLITK